MRMRGRGWGAAGRRMAPGALFMAVASTLLGALLGTLLAGCGAEPPGAPPGGAPFSATIRFAARPAAPELGPIDTLRIDPRGPGGELLVHPTRFAFDDGAPARVTTALAVPVGPDRAFHVMAVGERPVAGGALGETGRGILWFDRRANIDVAAGRVLALEFELRPFVTEFLPAEVEEDGAAHRIRWRRVPGADGYRLRIERPLQAPRDTTLRDTTYAAASLPARYQVRVVEYSGLAGAPSDWLALVTPLPPAPTGLRVTVQSGERLNVRWSSGGGFVTRWEIERREGEGAFGPLRSLGADTLQYPDTTVVDGRRYEYRVRGVNSFGPSLFTTPVGATTPLNPPAEVAAQVNDLEVSITWSDRSRSETGYEVQRRAGNGSFALLTTRPANAGGYVDREVAENTTYRYRVRALGDLAPSEWSAEATAVTPLHPPSAPGGLVAQAVGPMQVSLGWGASMGIVTQYEIERRTGGGEFSLRDTVPGDILAWVETGLTPATTYEYRVRGRNAAGPGNFTVAVSVTTPAE
jgi:hypothetical protein